MGCSPSKDKDEQDSKAAREANFRAALGASDQPTHVKKLEKQREEKKRQREAKEKVSRAEKDQERVLKSQGKAALQTEEVDSMPGKRKDESESEEEEPEVAGNSPTSSKKGGPTGDGSSNVVRGRLLQQIADQKKEITVVTEENARLQSELWNLKDSFDREVQGKKRMGKLQETESTAFQEAADQYREKLEATQNELQRMKKQLGDTFAASTLARLLPSPEHEAQVKKDQAALRKKVRDGEVELPSFDTGGGIFSSFGGAGHKNVRSSKGVDELIATIQEQSKENKEMKRDRDRLRRELDKWEKDAEEKRMAELEPGEGEEKSDKPWFQFGEPKVELEEEVEKLKTEIVELKFQLQASKDECERLKKVPAVAVAADAEPETPGWFGRLVGRGREDDISEAIDEAGQSESRVATSGETRILRAQVEELSHDVLRADTTLKAQLAEMTTTLSRELQAKAEACQMLEEQRAGALEQLANMQIEYDKVNSQLVGVLEVREEGGGVSELEELQVECTAQEERIQSLEAQVNDVVAANKELFAQTSEAMEENTALSARIEEVMAEGGLTEEALADAKESNKALQTSNTELQRSLGELTEKAITAAQVAKENPGTDDELSIRCSTLVDSLRIIQASKAVSDSEARTCSMWRSRCIELQAQRDAAVEVAAAVATAQGVEEAQHMIRNYFEEE